MKPWAERSIFIAVCQDQLFGVTTDTQYHKELWRMMIEVFTGARPEGEFAKKLLMYILAEEVDFEVSTYTVCCSIWGYTQ